MTRYPFYRMNRLLGAARAQGITFDDQTDALIPPAHDHDFRIADGSEVLDPADHAHAELYQRIASLDPGEQPDDSAPFSLDDDGDVVEDPVIGSDGDPFFYEGPLPDLSASFSDFDSSEYEELVAFARSVGMSPTEFSEVADKLLREATSLTAEDVADLEEEAFVRGIFAQQEADETSLLAAEEAERQRLEAKAKRLSEARYRDAVGRPDEDASLARFRGWIAEGEAERAAEDLAIAREEERRLADIRAQDEADARAAGLTLEQYLGGDDDAQAAIQEETR